MREETKYQSSPYLDEVEELKRQINNVGTVNLDEHHPLTINAVDPSLLRKEDKEVLMKNHGFVFEEEPKPAKKKPAKKAPAKKAAKK